MKISMHIQPSQFEFIGFEYEEVEGLSESVIECAISDYKRARGALKSEQGIEAKKYDKFIENQLLGETNQLETYNGMSDDQKRTVQCIKRALNRIKSREQQ